MRKTPDGRKQLRQSGFVVRAKPAPTGKAKSIRKFGSFATKEFVAWDGEGITDKFGRHHYILLAASTGDYLISQCGDTLAGLSTIDCFELLLDVASRFPNAYHVIYGGNYDANKILKDLKGSEYRLRKLWDTEGVFYKHYHIEWIRGKWLQIKNMETQRKVKLYDVISFFQQSFVKTLNDWSESLSPRVLKNIQAIEKMKGKRSQFKWSEKDRILKYCQQELEALVELMEAFRLNHLAAGLPSLTSLYGPGAIANSLLRKYRIQDHMLATDSELNTAALHAYAAGRIERLRYGNYEGPTNVYDINSAYPYTIAQLPSLAGGWHLFKFKGSNKPDAVPMSLYHIRLFNHDTYASPLFYRKGLAKSRPIFFPNPKGTNFIETWIWTPEYENLVDLGFPFEVIEGYLFQGNVNSRPFAWLEDLYYKRLEFKESGNPAEKNLKLAYNSIYGKFVQQAGYRIQKKIPKWHQIEWGGYVTSQCRSRLYRAMYSINFAGIVGVETDSIIVANNQVPNITLGNQLGEWGSKHFDGITYIQSGVYWLKIGDSWLDKYSKRRGYLSGTLTREAVLEAWAENPLGDWQMQRDGLAVGMNVMARGKEFITLGHCFRPGQTLDNWGDWREGPKKLSLWRSSKRYIDRLHNPANGLLTTSDQTDFCGWSSPYTLEWGDEVDDE